MKRKREAMSGPEKDPHFWQAVLGVLASIWPNLYAAGMAFVVALLRGVMSGGKPVKNLLEASLCGCITLSIIPVLNYLGLPRDLAVAIGAGIAFLGVKWLHEHIDDIARRIINKWLGRQ